MKLRLVLLTIAATIVVIYFAVATGLIR